MKAENDPSPAQARYVTHYVVKAWCGISLWCRRVSSEQGLMCWSAFEAGLPFLPVEIILVPLTRAFPESARRFVLLATVFSTAGSIYSYALGHYYERMEFWDGRHPAGSWLELMITNLDRWGEGFVFLGALIPVPLCLVGVGAGLIHLGLLPFLVTVMMGRALRFFIVTSLATHFNPRKDKTDNADVDSQTDLCMPQKHIGTSSIRKIMSFMRHTLSFPDRFR